MRRLVLLLSSLPLLACSSPRIRGADVADPGQEPRGKLVASYHAAECKDAAGAASPSPARVFVVDTPGGARVLVASLAGRDSLVVHDRFEDGTRAVYQAVLADGDGRRVIQDYRVPADGHGDGWMALGTQFEENDDDAPLHAKLLAPALTCKLASDEAKPAEDGGAPDP